MVPIHPFPAVRQTFAQGDCLDLSDSASKFEPRFSAKEWMKNRMSSLQTNPRPKLQKRTKLRHSCNPRHSSNKNASNDILNPKKIPKSILKRVMMARYFSKSSSERSPCGQQLLLSVALNCSASSLLLLQGSICIGSAKHCQAEMPDAMHKLFK